MILTRQVCEEAIALDPNYEAPYVLLGGTHIVDLWFNWAESPRSSVEKAVAALQKALSLYPNRTWPLRIWVVCMLCRNDLTKQ